MKRVVSLAVMFSLAACGGAKSEVKVDQTFSAQMAAQAVASALPNVSSLKVHAVCGASAGRGLFSDDKFGQFQADGISEGRLIFVSASDNSSADVVFRDVSGTYIFAVDDGADVRIIGPNSTTWVISYTSTGVVETHNLVMRDQQLIDLWTVNKPALSVWGPSAKVFTSNCFRP